MSDPREIPRGTDPPVKTPEQLAQENAFFSRPVCPCEEEEPEPMSEYDVPGEWVTYTGEVNETIFEYASLHAENESDRILRDLEKAAKAQMMSENNDPRQTELLSESSSEDTPAEPLQDLAASSANFFAEDTASAAEEVAKKE